ncbi:5'-nucleotidase C-terminal domain-containing protein [Microbacterium fluvii]|uniref:5'-nucleotidase C-terminal domain-containing protein n=1 Tax=Microbacterium fluvii TaxID=415215 RepID=A0ABW2HHQ1_9MICO|nr:5'-nucleotidase C-terminal domain-containing protein [Microbacterium fluvii]MCU4672638.1 5'-nucleotidase C-terminal domain-containing protein [Microbacterium fluvii]
MDTPSFPPRRAHRARIAVGATALTVTAALLAAPAAQAADPVVIDLVTVNDFHGRLENESGSAAGIAALAGAVDSIREKNANTVFAAAGDLIGASTFTSFIQQDEPTIAGLNAAGLDVSSVGNHEFDKGWADLRDRVEPLADWDYLAANLFDKATGDPILPEYWVTEFDGVSIGFVGAVTNELPSLVSPAGIADVTVGDVTDNVNRVADDLSDGDPANGEADVVVLLVHEGAATTAESSATDPASPFGRIVNGVDDDVDAIVSGHTHLAYNHVIDGRPVISSGQYGEKFSDMVIQVDPDTKQILSMVNTIHDMKVGGVLQYPEDPQILSDIVAPAKKVADEKGAVSLGSITADFNRALQPGLDANGNPALVENRGGESTLGNWVADVQLWAAQQDKPDTQIAFMNPGGLRADMKYASSTATDPDGNVTYKEAAAVQPFANTLVTLSLTGDQIRQVLEQQWQPAAASRPFLKLGVSEGLKYTFDPTAAAGSRITSITLDGAALDPDASYGVVVNSFLAAGGDNFGAFTLGTGKADSGKVDLESAVQWFEANETATPDLAQRAVGISLSAPTDKGYAVGSTIDVDLSSLDFTTTETPAGTVTLSIGGKKVGRADVDRTLTTANDLTGTASLSVVVPRGAKGSTTLQVTTPTGTVAQVPITVYEKTKTTTIGAPSKLFAKKGQTITYTVRVFAADRSAPTGTVVVSDGKKAIAEAELTGKGTAKVTLPALSKGVHLLSATYSGDDDHAGSTGPRVPVIVR